MTGGIAQLLKSTDFSGEICLFLPENVTRFPPITPFQPTERLLPTERILIPSISIKAIFLLYKLVRRKS